jgi:hypothetical protein
VSSKRSSHADEIRTPYRAPKGRLDGELYARPEPNPFTPDFEEGFQAGYERAPQKLDGSPNYQAGYKVGVLQFEEDREELDRAGSSNT